VRLGAVIVQAPNVEYPHLCRRGLGRPDNQKGDKKGAGAPSVAQGPSLINAGGAGDILAGYNRSTLSFSEEGLPLVYEPTVISK
jgi:hypothetical protein